MTYKQLKDKDGADFEPLTPTKVGFFVKANRVGKTINTEYTADANGYAWISASEQPATTSVLLVVDNAPVAACGTGGSTYGFNGIAPVMKGQTYQCMMGGGKRNGQLLLRQELRSRLGGVAE